MTSKPMFTVYRDKSGQFRWRLLAKNNRIIADSGEAYTRRRDCLRAVDTVLHAIFAADKAGTLPAFRAHPECSEWSDSVMKTKFAAFFSAALLFAAPSFAASPLTIHGYHPGMPQSAIKIADAKDPLRAENGIVPPTCVDADSLNCANMDTFTCRSEGSGVSSCDSNFKITYGPDWVRVTLDFMDAKCVAVFITGNSPDLFETRITALESKYGNPDMDDESQIQNHMGATFTDRTVTWVKNGNMLMANKYSSSVDRGLVSLVNMEAFHEYVSRKNAAKTSEYSDSM